MKFSHRYIFGSLVSGDFDNGSDIDVLVITDDSMHNCPDDWSVYSKNGIQNLFARGSLFAWHLYQTAIPVTEETKRDDYLRSIGSPAEYTTAIEEIEDLRVILSSAFIELNNKTPSNVYECGLIAVAIRDISMAASQHLTDKFNFSKFAPFLLGKFSLNISQSLYLELVNCRRSGTRGRALNKTNKIVDAVLKEEMKITDWISTLIKAIEAKT
jgi:hypothetical protein